jgi:hypothetical protein
MLAWSADRVLGLVEAKVPEGQSLEFKAELPTPNDKGRAELLKDVSALANANGGAILYGIKEKAACADSLSGLRLRDSDADVRRLAQTLESGIEPRLPGIHFTVVNLDGGDVLILDIPESLDSPHRYLFNGHSKFVQRMGTHTSELTYDQLRSAFIRTSTRIEKLRQQWADHLELKKTWRPMMPGPVCVVRLASLMSADERQIIDPKAAYDHWDKLIFPDWGGGSPSFNYDGLVAYRASKDEQAAMVQVSRTGAITAYRTARPLMDDRPLIPSIAIGDFIVVAAKKLIGFADLLGLRGSAILNVGLVRLSGYKLAIRDHFGFDDTPSATTDDIQMPEFWIDDLSNVGEIDHMLKPGFDLIWQTFGQAECPHFNSEGLWSPKR